MGFGRGKGFTSKVRTEMTEYSVKGGGGKTAITETELSPSYVTKYGGGRAAKTLTELNPTYSTEVTTEDSEEQTQSNAWNTLDGVNNIAYGQHLTIANRTVRKLGFWMQKKGSPTGDVHFTIRKISDDSLISDVIWGDASALPTVETYEEVAIPSPPTINEEVFIGIEAPANDANNAPQARYQLSDVKADEHVRRNYQGAWSDLTGWDYTYRYKYST